MINNKLLESVFGEIKIEKNSAQRVLIIPSDRLKLIFRDFYESVKNSESWELPLGIALATLTSILSSNFKDFVLKSYQWEFLFILTTIACFIIFAKNFVLSVLEKIKIGNPVKYFHEKAMTGQEEVATIYKKPINKKPSTKTSSDVFIKIPRNTSATALRQLKELLTSNLGKTKAFLVFESGKKVILPFKISWSSKLSEEINKILASFDANIPF